MTYHEIEQTAFELYNGSSSTKKDWLDEYTAYKNGEYNTTWNDDNFVNWNENEKKNCLNIILKLYDKLK